MDEPYGVLEHRCAIEMLLAVRDNPGLKKKDLMGMDGGNASTRFMRLRELTDAGLLTVGGDRMHNTMRMYLTPTGQEVAKHLSEAARLLSKRR